MIEVIMLGHYLDKYLMRVLFCKIPCPSFICFCKPSSHIYSSEPLKLENSSSSSPQVSPKCNHNSVPENSSDHNILDDVKNDDNKEEILDEKPTELAQNCLKSSLKKKPVSDSGSPNEKLKKKVQWKDYLGTELVEIREFESSEADDTDNEGDDNRSCICSIL